MAGHAQEIENIISVKFQNSVNTMSKATRHITLLYHQVGQAQNCYGIYKLTCTVRHCCNPAIAYIGSQRTVGEVRWRQRGLAELLRPHHDTAIHRYQVSGQDTSNTVS